MKYSGLAFVANEYDRNIGIAIPYYNDIIEQIIDLVNSLYTDKIIWLDTGCSKGILAQKQVFHKIHIGTPF